MQGFARLLHVLDCFAVLVNILTNYICNSVGNNDKMRSIKRIKMSILVKC